MTIASSAQVHPSAVIEDGAVIGPDVQIGPFCVVGPDVTLARGVTLKSHAIVTGWTRWARTPRSFPSPISATSRRT
jgi:UDP-N-acetylglucosamine acyltransferase